MIVWTVVELERENGKDKALADTRVFSTREKALAYLHERYLAAREWADAGSGEFSSDYSDDGWYAVCDKDNAEREGYLSEGTPVV